MDAEEAGRLVDDPDTSAETLRSIASSNPELRPQIEAHPNATPELLSWMKEDQEPDISDSDTESAGSDPEVAEVPVAERFSSWQPATTGPQRVVYVQAPPVKERRAVKTLILAAFMLFALSLVGITAAAFMNFGPTGKRPAPIAAVEVPQSSAVADSAQSDSSKESSKKKSSKKKKTYPAPKDAKEAEYMVDPNGNVACTVRGLILYCSVYEEYFADYGYETCNSWPATLCLGKSGAALVCDATPVGGWGADANLPYGTTAKSGKFACTSYEEGMSCWSTATGKSLVLSWRGWEGGTKGQVKEPDFPW